MISFAYFWQSEESSIGLEPALVTTELGDSKEVNSVEKAEECDATEVQ